MRPSLLFSLIWHAWAISWIVAAWWSAPTEKQVVTREALLYRALILLGALLLYDRTGSLLGGRRLWHVGYDGAYALAAATLLGIGFAWWARLHLGRLWSGTVTRKEGHRVIDTGPYALVRHPIYTGLIFAIVATAVTEATAVACAGAALIMAGLRLKAGIEERFLAAELGGHDYEAYRRRVPMLIPSLVKKPAALF